MENTCPKIPKCRLFNDKLLKKPTSYETYKNLYCLSSNRFKDCKRYIVSEMIGVCDDFVMPNSSLSIEKIIEKMKKNGSVK